MRKFPALVEELLFEEFVGLDSDIKSISMDLEQFGVDTKEALVKHFTVYRESYNAELVDYLLELNTIL